MLSGPRLAGTIKKRRAGSGREKKDMCPVSRSALIPLVARPRIPAIVPSDREPGTGYISLRQTSFRYNITRAGHAHVTDLFLSPSQSPHKNQFDNRYDRLIDVNHVSTDWPS